MIQMNPEEFRAYIRKHKIAGKKVLADFMEENPKEEYRYEDIDAVYQRQVDAEIGAHTIGRTRTARVGCNDGSGAVRTMSGMKYGHDYQ